MRLVLVAALSAGCVSAPGMFSGKYVHADTTLPVVPGTTLELTFDSRFIWTRWLGTVSVWDGCNTIGVQYYPVDGIMTRPTDQNGGITRTLQGCEPYRETEDQEETIEESFASSPSMIYEGETVTLDNGEDALVLIKPQPE